MPGFSLPEDAGKEPWKAARPDSDPEQAAMAFLCKQRKRNGGKLSEEKRSG